MGIQIANNLGALNAWRNLGVTNSALNKSVEKLSSGYRINRGADDPAGLLISETLRAQIGSIGQAMRNANDAVSMIQTAEGALTEMNTMLINIRSLAVHAANTGAVDSEQIAADQVAVDKAIQSMQRIAETTKFAGKNLLDGSAGTQIDITSGNTASFDGINVGAAGNSGTVDLDITAQASQAFASINISTLSNAASFAGSITLWLDGGVTQSFAWLDGSAQTAVTIAACINANTNSLGIVASANGDNIVFRSVEYGTDQVLRVLATGASVGATQVTACVDSGVDIAATLDGTALTGSGLVLYGEAGNVWEGTKLYMASGANTLQTLTNALSVTVGELTFALTQNAASADLVNYSIGDMQVSSIGLAASVSNTNGLNDIIDGGTYSLANDAESAIAIIDKAISDVSSERANLGAFQKYTLESTIANLGIAKENLTASESRIRDVDMAEEMMTFTKNQILVQAGVAMLAQANQLPQTVLQLLG